MEKTFSTFVNEIIGLITLFIPIIVGLAMVTFLYGLVLYIGNSGDESKRKESVQYIIYGLVGLFVMVSVWGLVGMIAGTFGEGVSIPQLN